MRLSCPQCGDANELAEDRLPPAGARGSCGKCGSVAVFDGSRLVAEAGDDTPPNPLTAEYGGAEDDTPAHPLDAVAEAEESAAAGDVWHVNTAAGQQGPLTLAQLKIMIRRDELAATDHVYGPAQDDWMPAGEREELHRYFAIKAKAAGAAAGAAGVAAAGSATQVDASDPFAWCAQHHTLEASWLCHACRLAWCSSCPEDKDLPGGRVRTCPQCQRPLAERQKLKPITPWWTELGKVFSFPVQGMHGIAIVVLCGFWFMQLLASMAPIYGPIAGYILAFAVLSWYLLVIRNLSTGGRGMPDMGKVENYIGGLFIPGLKAAVVGILAVLPYFLYSLFIFGPAWAEYRSAKWQQEQVQEEQAEPTWTEDWDSPGSAPSPGGDDSTNPQREALIEAMRSMGMSDEDIEASLAEMDAQEGAGGASDGWAAEDDGWEDPWQPVPPKAGELLLKGLGMLALVIYAIVVWPILLIIVALFNTIAPAFNPPLVLRIAKEVWPIYQRLIYFLIPVGLIAFFIGQLTEPSFGRGMQLALMGFPAGLRVIFVPVSIYLDLVMMYAIGRTAEMIDREIDWF